MIDSTACRCPEWGYAYVEEGNVLGLKVPVYDVPGVQIADGFGHLLDINEHISSGDSPLGFQFQKQSTLVVVLHEHVHSFPFFDKPVDFGNELTAANGLDFDAFY
jgi:hypothetical protein